jgi:hypothetical protein
MMPVKEDFLSGVIALADEHPERPGRLIKAVWPQIKAAIERGHTLKLIHQRLISDGVRISYRQFTAHVRQLLGKTAKRRETTSQAAATQPTAPPKRSKKERVFSDRSPSISESAGGKASIDAPVLDDPWANVRDRLHTHRPGFQWNDEEVIDR